MGTYRLRRRCASSRGREENDWVFPSRGPAGERLSIRQYARLVGERGDLGPTAYGTDVLRRTKVAQVHTTEPATCALVSCYWATESRSTIRYLVIELDNATRHSLPPPGSHGHLGNRLGRAYRQSPQHSAPSARDRNVARVCENGSDGSIPAARDDAISGRS
jgi:hypothetical protein